MYVIVNMDASADKSDWRAPRLADLRRQRSKPCWLYKHEFYLWIVNVDRETGCGSALTTQSPVDEDDLEGREVLDAVQGQLDEFELDSGSWDISDENVGADFDEDVGPDFDDDVGPYFDADVPDLYDTDGSSPYDSSWKTSSESRSEIIPKQPEHAPATSPQVTKISSFEELIWRLRLPLSEQQYIEDRSWKPTSNPKILDSISRILFEISLESRIVPSEVTGDPCVAHHLGYSLDNDIATENVNHLTMRSPSPLGYDRVRLEFVDLTHVLLASRRLQITSPYRDVTRNAWHGNVHLPLMQLLRIQYPELSVEQVRCQKPGVLNTSMYTAATPKHEIADFELSWKSESNCFTEEEATRFDTSLITFWPPENPHDSVRIIVTETRRLCNSDWIVETQVALSAMSQFRQLHQIQNGDTYFPFAIPILVAIRKKWWLYFALDGEKITTVEFGILGYTEWLDTTLKLLASLKAVVGFVNEEVLTGYKVEVLNGGKEGGRCKGQVNPE